MQVVARLVAPVHVARQCGHAGGLNQRCAATAMTWPSLSRHMHWRDKPVAPCGLARRGQYLGPCRPLLPHPPFLSLTPPRSDLLQGVAAGRPPRPPQIRIFGGEKVGGIVPHPSPKVLPLISHRLTVCISSYWCFFVIRVRFLI